MLILNSRNVERMMLFTSTKDSDVLGIFFTQTLLRYLYTYVKYFYFKQPRLIRILRLLQGSLHTKRKRGCRSVPSSSVLFYVNFHHLTFNEKGNC